MATTLDRYIASKTSQTSGSSSGGTTLDKYISKQGTSLEEIKKRLAERDAQYKQQQAQIQTPVQQPEQSFLQKAGSFITQTALPAIKEKALQWGKAGAALLEGSQAQFLPKEQQAQASQNAADVLAGGAKNIGELASGTGKVIAKVATSQYNPLNPMSGLQQNEEVKKAKESFIDSSGILNYKPEYKNEYQKTGGEIAEIGSWLIPVSRIGKVEKAEKALIELPKVAKFLGTVPKLVKSGGKFFYEVGKDAVDIGVLDLARGKDWQTIKEDLKTGAIGAGVLRGVGGAVGAIIKSNPTKIIEKSIGKLSDEEVKLSEELLKSGKTTDEVLNEITKAREAGVTPIQPELTPRTLKPGELAPAVKRIEQQTETLTPSQALLVKNDLEKGLSEEAIVNKIVSPVETPAIEVPKIETPKIETPKIETPKVEPIKTELPKVEVEKTPSKVAKSIEAKAIEEKLTKGFGDIAGYDKITVKDQAARAAKLLDEKFDDAVKMIEGSVSVEQGLNKATLIKTMEDYAQAKGDVDLLRKLAKSPLVSETSEAAQTLRMLAERNPESALANIQDVVKERSKRFAEKTGKTTEKATKDVVDEIKKKIKQPVPTKETWTKFINEITC